MTQERLKLYTIDPAYLWILSAADINVLSVRPSTCRNPVPFAGIIDCCGKSYCVPIMSPKPKYEGKNNGTDFTKIVLDGQLYGVLNFNNMIPVTSTCLTPLNLQESIVDTPDDISYKKLLAKEQTFCQQNQNKIVRKANRLYNLIATGNAGTLAKRCCDFTKLENALASYLL